MDDAFRQQLESVQAAHQAELMRLANEKQKQIEQANQKVKSILLLQVLGPGVFIHFKYGQSQVCVCHKYSHIIISLQNL